MTLLLALIYAIAFILLILAIYKGDTTFAVLSGFLFILTAIFLWVSGVDLGDRTLNNFWTQGAALITLGLGIYLMIRSTMEEAVDEMDKLQP